VLIVVAKYAVVREDISEISVSVDYASESSLQMVKYRVSQGQAGKEVEFKPIMKL